MPDESIVELFQKRTCELSLAESILRAGQIINMASKCWPNFARDLCIKLKTLGLFSTPPTLWEDLSALWRILFVVKHERISHARVWAALHCLLSAIDLTIDSSFEEAAVRDHLRVAIRQALLARIVDIDENTSEIYKSLL